MPVPDTRFDLIAVQRLSGALLDTLACDIPAGEALDALTLSTGEELGYGTVTMLVSARDPLYQLQRELQRARGKHAPLHSAHEAYAVILEELDEFWTEVKVRAPSSGRMRAELLQIAAMAIRAIEDLEL